MASEDSGECIGRSGPAVFDRWPVYDQGTFAGSRAGGIGRLAGSRAGGGPVVAESAGHGAGSSSETWPRRCAGSPSTSARPLISTPDKRLDRPEGGEGASCCRLHHHDGAWQRDRTALQGADTAGKARRLKAEAMAATQLGNECLPAILRSESIMPPRLKQPPQFGAGNGLLRLSKAFRWRKEEGVSMFKRYLVRSYEAGLHFHNDEFVGVLTAGTHWLFDPLGRARVEVVSMRQPWLAHDKLDLIVKSGDADRPGHGARPEGLRARPGLDRRPIQPRPAAGPSRLLDDPARSSRRGRGCSAGPLRPCGPGADRPVHDGRTGAGDAPGRTGPAGNLVPQRRLRGDVAAGPVRVLEERGAAEGRRRWTCARRRWMWPARKS